MFRRLLQRLRRGAGAQEATALPPAEARRKADLAALCRLLGEFEGLRLKAYQCSAGVWTIGYGATRTLGKRPVKEGMIITEATAQKLLWRDASKAYDRIVKGLRADASAGARVAFASLAFNVGVFAVLKSDALRCYNEGHLHTAKREFAEWRKAGGRVVQGLVNRRRKEWALIERDEGP